MRDAYSYCAELVRSGDRDRFVASLFASAQNRDALHALYAFNLEIGRVREAAQQALAGEIRLQWWTEVLSGDRSGEAAANPVAAALLATLERERLSPATLLELIEAHRFDLYDEPLPTIGDLEDYARKTSSAIFALAAQVLAGSGLEPCTGPAGTAYTIAGFLSGFPRHAARRHLYVPVELLERHGVNAEDIFAGRTSSGIKAALGELRDVGRRHLAAVRACLPAAPPEALPALLPLAPIGLLFDRLDRSDPFSPAEISALRRQWLIWRAARNPARLAA